MTHSALSRADHYNKGGLPQNIRALVETHPIVKAFAMAVSIRPLEEADIPTFVRVELEAFRPHPRIPMLWPKGYTDDLYAFYESRKTVIFRDKECRFMKAVEDKTDEIVAVSEWTFALDAQANAKEQPIDYDEAPPANWPEGGNWELRRFFKIEWEKWRRENLAAKPYIRWSMLPRCCLASR